MKQLLKGKRAIVTGGSRGIGRAIAKEFINEGAKVLITGRSEEALVQITEKQDNLEYLVWDATDFDNYNSNIKKSYDKLGGNIDILVNNAGVLTQNDFMMNYLDLELNEWDLVMDTNLKAVYFMCQSMAKYMIENNIKGHIINIGSEMGRRPACVSYGISKWGVEGLTKGFGQKLASKGIIVNGIAPGATTTSMMNWSEGDSIERKTHANGRFGFPEEIARLAAYLASDFGENIIGEMILCDGGSSLY